MYTRLLFLIVVILGASLVSCAPAVPYNQMPGGSVDLYGGANSSRMTADAALQQAQWQEQAMTASAQAPIVHITETAAALAVQATQAQSTSMAAVQTQAGAMSATAIWWTPTPNATGTLSALALSSAQTQTTLTLQRQNDMNDFKGKLPTYSFVIVVLVLAIVLTWVSRRQRYQFAQVDARGNVLPVLDVVDGTFTDIDRSPNFKGSVSNDLLTRFLAMILEKKFGVKPLLPEITASRQDAIAERDQMIDLASRGLPGPSTDSKQQKQLAGQEMMKQISTSTLNNRFKMLDEVTTEGVIDGTIVQVLDHDWKEAETK